MGHQKIFPAIIFAGDYEGFQSVLPWILVLFVSVVAVYLAFRLYYIHKSLDEMKDDFSEQLRGTTNMLVGISSEDAHIMGFLEEMNRQLEIFHEERQKFIQGDRELKEAITNVSHDLRTPLTVICGYLSMLKDEKMSESAKRYLEKIEDRSEVMCQLLEELLDYSIHASVGELELEDVSLNRILEENILVYYEEMSVRKIVPEIHMPDMEVKRMLNRAAMDRICGNILSNVMKYSDGDLSVELEESGVVTFSNSASFLNPVMAGKLSDRFFTLDTGTGSSCTSSTGIGLSEVKLLTERMGGSVRIWHSGGRLFIRLAFPQGHIS